MRELFRSLHAETSSGESWNCEALIRNPELPSNIQT